MFLRGSKRLKDGKEHCSWSIVENKRVGGGKIVQRHVLYLGEINDRQCASWRKTIEVFEDGAPRPRTVALFPDHPTLGATLPMGSASQSFILEVVLTFLLMLVVLSVSTGAKEKGITAGIAIGAIIALEAMFAGPICGASMNPARSLAPAIVSGNMTALWLYLTAPILGALLAIPACIGVRESGCCGNAHA